MKKIFLLAISLLVVSFTAKALEPVGIVFPYTSESANITCELIDYGAEGGMEPIYTQELGELTPNEIAASSISTYYVVNLKVDNVIKAQYRLDELINLSARTPSSSSSSLTSSEFTSTEELGDLLTNIFVYTGEGNIDLDKNNFNENLPGNATYMLANSSDDDSDINFLFPPESTVTIKPREYIILLKVGNNYYFQLKPFGPL